MSILDVFASVVKADDAAGAAFIDTVVSEYLADEAQAVRKDLVAVISLNGMDRIQLAKRKLGQQYVQTMVEGRYPDQSEFGKHARWLNGLESYVTAVSKDLEWFSFLGGRREQRDVERDARGRFARKISGRSVSLDQRNAEYERGSRRMAPAVRSSVDAKGGMQELLRPENAQQRTELERIQGDYEATARVASEFKRDLKGARESEVEVEVMFLEGDPNNPDVVSRRFTLDQFQDGELPEGLDFGTGRKPFAMQVQAKRGASDKTQRVVGAYNLLGEQGGSAMASLAGVDDDRLRALSASLGMDASPDASGLTRFFNRLQAGGNVLAQVTGQEKLGEAVAFVGSIGPQAEQVLGPYAQRTAYRYRGTETTPSNQLLGQMREVSSPQATASLSSGEAAQISPATPVEGIMRGVGSLRLDKDSAVMQARGDVASANLAQTLPKDPMLARLSELSGQVLPSQGVLIDADGKVVSQSVGSIDDHYLPFDLLNLGDLRGGQYARTRMSGGLTGEDIYASVFYGARQAQVISPSGVFTLEFAPDFRGARSSVLQAKQMQDRYLKILDAVDNSDQYLLDISPTEKQRIKNEVRDMGFKGEDAKIAEEERIDAARRSQSQLTADDEAMAREKVMADMGLTEEKQITANGQTARAFEEQYADEIDRMRSMKANKLRLNGEGYAMALATLQQQFPYFIKRVEYRPLNDFARVASLQGAAPKGRTYADDSGYTKPGSLRAKNIRSGFYDRGPLQPGPKKLPGERGRQQEAERAAAAAAAPAAPDAPEQTGTEATETEQARPQAPMPADATVGVSQRLKGKEKILSETIMSTANDLSAQLGKVEFDSETLSGMQLEMALSQPKSTFAAWLMIKKPNELANIFANRDLGMAAAAALASPKDVEDAISMIAFGASAQGTDFWAKGGQLGDESVQAGDMAGSIRWVSEQAQKMADAFLMQHPFVQGSDPLHGAKGNVLVPQASPQMASISNTKQLQDFAASHEDTWEDAKTLMLAGNAYKSLGEIGLDAKAKVKALSDLAELQRSIPPDAKNEQVIDLAGSKDRVVAMLTGLDGPEMARERFDEALDAEDGLVALVRGVNVQDEGRRLQNAWSLAMTTRLIEALDRGDVLPFGDRRLAKSAPRVEVLGLDHPLSQAVAARVAKGLPFVPVRTGRRLTSRV